MDERRRRAWQALDIGPRWQSRSLPSTSFTTGAKSDEAPDRAMPEVIDRGIAQAVGAVRSDGLTVADAPSRARSWTVLQEAVGECCACALSASRSQTVFGAGPQPAAWMLVGEAPGEQEDLQGRPFVGPAGQLLDQMLLAIGVDRPRDAFITNILKCRPPGNRDPQPQEVALCTPYLREQIEAVRPRLILALGRFAAQTLLQTDASLASLRGQVHAYRSAQREIPLVVTYHPAYLLRTLPDKARAWVDLRLARRQFDLGQGD